MLLAMYFKLTLILVLLNVTKPWATKSLSSAENLHLAKSGGYMIKDMSSPNSDLTYKRQRAIQLSHPLWWTLLVFECSGQPPCYPGFIVPLATPPGSLQRTYCARAFHSFVPLRTTTGATSCAS